MIGIHLPPLTPGWGGPHSIHVPAGASSPVDRDLCPLPLAPVPGAPRGEEPDSEGEGRAAAPLPAETECGTGRGWFRALPSGRAAARRGSRPLGTPEGAPPQCGSAAPVRAPRIVTPCGSTAASGERPWGGAGLPAGRWGYRQGGKEGGRKKGSRRGDFLLLLLGGSSKQLRRWSGRHGWAPARPPGGGLRLGRRHPTPPMPRTRPRWR